MKGRFIPPNDNCASCGEPIVVPTGREGTGRKCEPCIRKDGMTDWRPFIKPRQKCVSCTRDVSFLGPNATRCATHAVDGRIRQELDSAPPGARWEAARCACGRIFVKRRKSHVNCDACASKAKSSWRPSAAPPPRSALVECSNCHLAFGRRPGDGDICPVCVVDALNAAGLPIGQKLSVRASGLRRSRGQASVPKPPPGKCYVCGERSTTWYCSAKHMRIGYQMIQERISEMKKNGFWM